MKEKIEKLRTNKENRTTFIQAIVGFSLLTLLMVSSISLIYSRSVENARISHENQGYIRYMACVIDVRNELETITVSNEISEACWQEAEKETGIKLARYSGRVLLDK